LRPLLVLLVFLANALAIGDALARPGRGTLRSILLIVFLPVIGVVLHVRRRRAEAA
jgi:hypothetical protein